MNMAEDQIELIVERTMDKLDRQLTDGKLSQTEYDLEVSRLETWAQQQYKAVA